MRYNNIELNILVNGKNITEYAHKGQTFIEGRAKSNFTLQITNKNNFKTEAVVSVDGLSIIDGKEAGPTSSGYLLEANETISIPGWKLNDAEVAAFEFVGKEKSYASLSSGSARNNGVIGVMTFKEKATVHTYQAYNPYIYTSTPFTTCLATTSVSDTFGQSCGVVGMNAISAATCSIASAPVSIASDQSAFRTTRSLSKGLTSGANASVAIANTLGTGFGVKQDFATTSATFTRGDLHAMFMVFYDDAQGLKKRGIVLDRVSKNKNTQTPNPFPGMNCAPPEGWQG